MTRIETDHRLRLAQFIEDDVSGRAPSLAGRLAEGEGSLSGRGAVHESIPVNASLSQSHKFLEIPPSRNNGPFDGSWLPPSPPNASLSRVCPRCDRNYEGVGCTDKCRKSPRNAPSSRFSPLPVGTKLPDKYCEYAPITESPKKPQNPGVG